MGELVALLHQNAGKFVIVQSFTLSEIRVGQTWWTCIHMWDVRI